MINALTVSNYRSIGDVVRVDIGQFTALVGRNGAGKSSILDALRFVSEAIEIGLSGAITHRHGIAAIRRWTAGHPRDLLLELDLSLPAGHATYGFTLTGSSENEYDVKREQAILRDRAGGVVEFLVESGDWKKGPSDLRPRIDKTSLALPVLGGDKRFRPLVDALRAMQVYEIFPDVLRKPQSYSAQKPMDRHGSNWASILKEQPEASWKDQLVIALNKLTGDIDDVRVATAAGFLVVELRHVTGAKKKREKWFSVSQESDGTLRAAGIVTALLQRPALTLVSTPLSK